MAVCRYDAARGVGGANHFLLPHHAGERDASPRFGPTAIARLLDEVLRLGASREALEAKLFGGACVIEAFRGQRDHLGTQNVAVAQRLLAEAGIPLRAQDVGGSRGRKLLFRVSDGGAWVKPL